MATFEDIKPGGRLRGLDPAGIAEIVQVALFGPNAANLVLRVNGRVGERLVYRDEEAAFEVVEAGRTYAFDADGALLRLASEAHRLRLAYMFDPYLAISALRMKAAARTAEGALRFAENVAPIIREIRASGVASLRGIAAALNARGVRTARGGRWAATQVGAVLARTEARAADG